MSSCGLIYYGGLELNFLVDHGEKFFDAQDVAACLGYVQSKDKHKHTGWQWTLFKEMPEEFKRFVTPRKGRTINYYSISGILWLERRVVSKARRKINRAQRANFYEWLYKTFPEEIRQAKARSI